MLAVWDGAVFQERLSFLFVQHNDLFKKKKCLAVWDGAVFEGRLLQLLAREAHIALPQEHASEGRQDQQAVVEPRPP